MRLSIAPFEEIHFLGFESSCYSNWMHQFVMKECRF